MKNRSEMESFRTLAEMESFSMHRRNITPLLPSRQYNDREK